MVPISSRAWKTWEQVKLNLLEEAAKARINHAQLGLAQTRTQK
jgi:hypothetical protein